MIPCGQAYNRGRRSHIEVHRRCADILSVRLRKRHACQPTESATSLRSLLVAGMHVSFVRIEATDGSREMPSAVRSARTREFAWVSFPSVWWSGPERCGWHHESLELQCMIGCRRASLIGTSIRFGCVEVGLYRHLTILQRRRALKMYGHELHDHRAVGDKDGILVVLITLHCLLKLFSTHRLRPRRGSQCLIWKKNGKACISQFSKV